MGWVTAVMALSSRLLQYITIGNGSAWQGRPGALSNSR